MHSPMHYDTAAISRLTSDLTRAYRMIWFASDFTSLKIDKTLFEKAKEEGQKLALVDKSSPGIKNHGQSSSLSRFASQLDTE